jgi:copper(I)-binding protein
MRRHQSRVDIIIACPNPNTCKYLQFDSFSFCHADNAFGEWALRRSQLVHPFLKIHRRPLMQLISLIMSAALLLAGVPSHAGEYQAGEIRIDNPYARPTMPGQTSGGAYLTLENKGKNPDKLISIASPAAKAVEIHTMSMDGNIMKMREVTSIELKPSDRVEMKPGHGYHIMLIGIKKPLQVGDKIPLMLTFEKSGKVEISASVESNGPKAAKEKATHQHHRH